MDDLKTLHSFDIQYHDRPETACRASPLMVGEGRTRTQGIAKHIDLHLEPTEISVLITHRAKSAQSMFRTASAQVSSCATGSTNHVTSPRAVEVNLPKTYVTRSGSLMIYSDSKAVGRDVKSDVFRVHGHAVTSRLQEGSSLRNMRRLFTKKQASENKEPNFACTCECKYN